MDEPANTTDRAFEASDQSRSGADKPTLLINGVLPATWVDRFIDQIGRHNLERFLAGWFCGTCCELCQLRAVKCRSTATNAGLDDCHAVRRKLRRYWFSGK